MPFIRLLLLRAEPATRIRLQAFLQSLLPRAQVTACEHDAAAQLLRDFRPDVVVLGAPAADSNGTSALLAEAARHAYVRRILLVTPLPREHPDVRAACRDPRVVHLAEPIDAAQLRAALRSHDGPFRSRRSG